MNNVYNNIVQYYKEIPLTLIIYTEKHFNRLKAKRFMLGDTKYNQNIWIPNVYLEPNGTLKSNINIDFIFHKAYQQNKINYAHLEHIYQKNFI